MRSVSFDIRYRFGEVRSYFLEDHRRIFQAVVDRDPEGGDRVVREHFAIGDEFRRRAAIGNLRSAASG